MIENVLGFFTPKNMRVDVVSKSFAKSQDIQCEPWFKSRYTEEDISPSLMELWCDSSEIDICLHLPAKNEFIPRDFSICASKASSANVVKLETSVTLFSDKLELKVYGFNDKLSVLLSKVLAIAKSFSPTENHLRHVIKEDMERTLRNTNMKPLNHSSYLRLQVLYQSFLYSLHFKRSQSMLHLNTS
ncbi:hypothetical protein HYC85_025831 [Camellia sinensis]|uniref:Peptidase M16 middle/third domain-containing protein n=1 Tax=Camellia sinensis TaxID=4442 RepID=A0A7J7G202_CAMSI|nr:hypothetical protein HYC85_025831 [Camellia sinensis]